MHTDPSASFGELLKRHRLAASLSQEELAERAGLSPRGVSDLERGARTNPRPGTLRLLADALALTHDERAAFLASAQGSALPVPAPSADSVTPPTAEAPSTSAPLPASPPIGTVTFLFTDIEGSTRLLQRLGPLYANVLGEHQRILRAAFAAHEGYEVDTQGDSFFVAFPTALAALTSAAEATQALAVHPWPEDVAVRVRMGLHTGAPQLAGNRYVGLDVHRAARIAAAGHGGQILLSAAAAELARHDVPDGITLRDLGAHRLKDLQQAEHVYQLVLTDLPADFPPLKALDARSHNLPVQSTLLLGREREVEAIRTLLRRDDVRLVTLTGPGGIGKTRLSVQVAAEVLDAFPDGVWNVRLARLTDPALVVPTIATTLDLKESGGTPLADVLRGYLRDKHLLLVLDNFEHVVVAALSVAEVLECCPGVKVLVTSRVALHLRGEQEYALRPLALPDPAHLLPPERLSQYAAIALFIERAQAAQTDFAVTNATAPAVAEICARLDGLPLAIELAAARVKLLPPPALLKRLERSLPVLTGGARDLDERQQTMRATLAWSYDLLAPEEQRLFRQLAVFVGGCTLEAIEEVCTDVEGAEALEIDLLEGLSRLVDQSLVLRREEEGEPRFGMLHVVQEFALEQFAASDGGTGTEVLRRAHAAYYVALDEREWAADDDGVAVIGDMGTAHIEWVELEQDNLRAALAWLQAQAEAAGRTSAIAGVGESQAGRAAERWGEAPVVQGLRLTSALLWPWAYRGQLGEGRAWLEVFLALDGLAAEATGNQAKPGEGALPAARRDGRTANVGSVSLDFVRARAQYAAGVLAYWQGDTAEAVPLLERSLACWQALGDRRRAGYALNNLGLALQDQGDLAHARACYEASLTQGRSLNRRDLIGMSLSNLACLALAAGDLEQAARYSEEAFAICRPGHEYTSAAECLIVQALIAKRLGHLSQAAILAEEALVLHRTIRDERHYGDGIEVCAIMCASQGQGERAAHLLGAAAAQRERIGMRRPMVVPTADDIEAAVAPARTALGGERWAAAFAAGRELSLEEAIAEALGENVGLGREE